ncbi:S66 peptidase family protein [Arcticibacterium luteifluviistationis]|uniref:LD-carboxypeptidase n=1 Tax=Arcticibacterium luteifluviistationis TaxID=1784714 RepID=A0A2Z4G8Q4_9BACT|nr:LD-carboxypeptidase [Arcticibacterium luteifluviistationis]AWV97587.1 LD-carboxypeptidase [Arcticibacterium luteifluviistationis]
MKPKALISPPPLKKGDKVGIVSLSSVLDEKRLLEGKEIIENDLGFEAVYSKNILNVHHNFAGTDEEKILAFQEMLDNPEIKGIIAGRGGYGASKIIDKVNWETFKQNPKWLVGFSDLTVVHQKLQSFGIQSIHGPMMVTLKDDKKSTTSLKNALTGKNLKYKEKGHHFNREGECQGQVVGGNLCLLAHNIGSTSDISFDNKILFLEDVGEFLYNIDRMMVQLRRAGKLKNLAGLIVGQFSDLKETTVPFGKTAFEIIEEHVSEFSYPVTYDFPIGHENENRAIRCGEIMKLEVLKDMVKLSSI